jgi:outer membrane protein assembly factor BamB
MKIINWRLKMIAIRNRFFLLAIWPLLFGCYRGKRGDIFVDYFGKNLVVKKEGKTLKYRLNRPTKGESNVFRDGDNVYIISVDNSVAKFSLKDSKMLWQKTIASVPMANFAFNGGKLYFTTLNNAFYILDGETGKIDFIYSNINRTSVTVCLKPLFYRNLVIVTFSDGEVIIFDRESKNIVKKIPSRLSGKKISVTLENSLLSINDEKIDLNKIGKK